MEIKKVGIRYGHSQKCRGASGIIDEVDSCMLIVTKVAEKLAAKGYEIVNCGSSASTVAGELNEGTNRANSNNVDLYVTIHMNAFNGNARGTECWVYDTNSSTAIAVANRICSNISALGTPNRGVKYSKNFHDLNASAMDAIIVETLFCDNQSDAAIFNSNVDGIALAIAQGIDPNISGSKSKCTCGCSCC